jgi:hypothetical protein
VLPNPLHPAVVHFPVVLAFLLPLFVAGAVWAIRRGASVRRAWLVPVAGATALALSAWAAVQTGGAQGERVERVVSEQVIDSHEEMAEAFLAASAGVAVVALAGLVGGLAGRAARVLTGIGALVLVGLGARVGHSGGQLVYRYGAASAYTSRGVGARGDAANNESAIGRRAQRGVEDDR